MPRGGRREPREGKKLGRPHKPKLPAIETKAYGQQLLDALNKPAQPNEPYHVMCWRRLTESGDLRIELDSRSRIEDRALGKAVHTVNHLHDKPVEHLVTHTISERMRIAIEKAEKRVSGNR